MAYTDYVTDSRVWREAETLAQRGDSVDVVCLESDSETRPSSFERARLLPIRMKRFRGESKLRFLLGYLKFLILAFLRVSRLSASARYDVVQVHSFPDALVFTALLPRLLGARVLLDIRDPMPEGFMVKYGLSRNHLVTRLIRLQERLSARFADEVLCVSEQHKGVFVEHGIPESKLSIIRNLPEERSFSTNVKETRTADGFELVFHGTITRRLGVDIAVRAINIVMKEIPRLTFKVYGGGEFMPALRHLVRELDLDRHVFLSGKFHPYREIPSLIRSAQAGIVPNRKNLITDLMMPVKLLEYVSLGMPVIAPRINTVMHYFDEDMLRFFDPGDPEDLAQAILDIYYKPEQANRRAERASLYLDKYNWKSESERYCMLIDKPLRTAC